MDDVRNHQAYYQMRAATSRTLAGQAVNKQIAAIHAELAERYDKLSAQSGRSNAIPLLFAN